MHLARGRAFAIRVVSSRSFTRAATSYLSATPVEMSSDAWGLPAYSPTAGSATRSRVALCSPVLRWSSTTLTGCVAEVQTRNFYVHKYFVKESDLPEGLGEIACCRLTT